jgi:hypothetical protein
MDTPYHYRALDESGTTIRQSTVSFATVEAAQKAADKASRIHGDDHVVCVSIDPKDQDPETKKNPLRVGWAVHQIAAPVVVPVVAPV